MISKELKMEEQKLDESWLGRRCEGLLKWKGLQVFMGWGEDPVKRPRKRWLSGQGQVDTEGDWGGPLARVGLELGRDVADFQSEGKKVKSNEYRYVYREIEWDLPDDLNFSTDVKARSPAGNEISSCLEEGLRVSLGTFADGNRKESWPRLSKVTGRYPGKPPLLQTVNVCGAIMCENWKIEQSEATRWE